MRTRATLLTRDAAPTPGPQNLRLRLLPGRGRGGGQSPEYYRQTQQWWLDWWSGFWNEPSTEGGREALQQEFCRQDIVAGAWHGETLAGIITFRRFDLGCALDRADPYFLRYDADFLRTIRQRGATTALAYSHLSVGPGWRHSQCGMPLGAALFSLGANIQRRLGIDVGIGAARREVGVPGVSYRLGFDCIQADRDYRGFRVDMIAGFRWKLRPSEDANVRDLVASLWSGAEDSTGMNLLRSPAKIGRSAPQGEENGVPSGSVPEI